MPIILILKLTLVPMLIGLVTLSGRRWGPQVAGWLSALPMVAGPILFFIAMERGNEFATTAATATLSAVLATIVFGLVYAWAALRLNWVGSLAMALSFYVLAVLGLEAASPSLYVGTIANLLAIAVAPRLFPNVVSRPTTRPSSRLDLPLRMSAGAVLVFLITFFAAHLGPRLSGIFAMFPVMGIVLTVFSHRSAGKEFAINLLRGMQLGWYAFSTFCFTLALLLPNSQIGVAFPIAIAAALVVQIGSRRFVRSS